MGRTQHKKGNTFRQTAQYKSLGNCWEGSLGVHCLDTLSSFVPALQALEVPRAGVRVTPHPWLKH